MNNNSLQRNGLCIAGLGLSLILTACGGGGGGETGTPAAPVAVSATGSNAGALLINEVSSNYHDGAGAWLELYNSGKQDISLKGMGIRAKTLDGSVPVTYALPDDQVIKAGGFLLVATKTAHVMQSTDQMIYIGDKASTPFWDDNGAVELVQNGVTLDFVRFGNSQFSPLTASAWTGANVPALPGTTLDYGKSLVRLMNHTNTHSRSDWAQVDFSTPGGPNDVAAGAADLDKDGIPDSAEVPGGTFAGVDYYRMGARAGTPDIFIQMDHMKSDDPGILPAKEALQKVVDAFKLKNIAVHFDAGNLYSPVFSLDQFNLGGGKTGPDSVVAYSQCLGLDESTDCATIFSYKDKRLDIRRKQVFHYLLMGNSQNPDGSHGSSGLAEIFGNDFMVTLGHWGLSTDTPEAKYLRINYQAGTIMHELGHNLGLMHGGDEYNNNKPNYYSTMNYLYQLMGLGTDPKSIAPVERYYLDRDVPGYEWSNQCKLEGSPCGPDFRISYSDGTGTDLNEKWLVESELIGRGSNSKALYADWDYNGLNSGSVFYWSLDDRDTYDVLHDYNDWDNLYLNFSRFSDGNSGASKKRSLAVTNNPVLNDRQRWAEETAPSAAFFAAVRRVR